MNVAFRRKTVELQNDLKFVFKRGHPLENKIAELPKDIPLGQ